MKWFTEKFVDYAITHEIGATVDEGIPDRNQEVVDMGIPNTDYDSIFID